MSSYQCPGHTNYVAGCPGCQRRGRLKNGRRRGLVAAGQLHRSEPVGPLQQHITALRAAGMSVPAIAEASGVPAGTVYHIAHGRTRYVFGFNAARLWAVKSPRPTPPRGFVDPIGPRRRVQALAAIGHSLAAQRARVGLSPAACYRLTSGIGGYVAAKTAADIADLYRDWSEKPGASLRAITSARKQGWAPPIAWDDDTIDDPNAQPQLDTEPDPDLVDEVKVQRALAGVATDLTNAEIVATLQAGLNRGEAISALCLRLGISRGRADRLLAAATTAEVQDENEVAA